MRRLGNGGGIEVVLRDGGGIDTVCCLHTVFRFSLESVRLFAWALTMSDKTKARLSKTWLKLKNIPETFHSRSPSPQPPSTSSPSSQPPPTLPTASPTAQPPPTSQPSHSQSSPNEYMALSTSPALQTPGQRMKQGGSIAYAGLKQVALALRDCSDAFPPLKTAAAVFSKIAEVVDRVSTNKEELEELQAKLEVIKSIVEKYKKDGMEHIVNHRIEKFCEAVVSQEKMVEELANHSLPRRAVESTIDVDKIKKVLKNMSDLCIVFQMETQLNTDTNVSEILERQKSSIIDKLRYEETSYDTRRSSYGAARGCMPGTRVKVLADLETWALDGEKKLYWLVGMAGTGKSTILHTLCQKLDDKNRLGASFFCSRASDNASNAYLIVPAIAHSLAGTSPSIRSEIVKALEAEPKLSERSYIKLEEQFRRLIHDPIQTSLKQCITTYKIIVIDALDECTDLDRVSALLQVILSFAPYTALKFVIASRDESPIRKALRSRPNIRDDLVLHEVEKDVVTGDIAIYLEGELAAIHERECDASDTSDSWPPQDQLSTLLNRSGTLFIYAATAIRYISDGDDLYKDCLHTLATQGSIPETGLGSPIDDLYGGILEGACKKLDREKTCHMRELVSIVVFLRNPLPLKAITSLSQPSASEYLSRLRSVFHIPTPTTKDPDPVVTPFHASFPDFVKDTTWCSSKRCPSFHALVSSEAHSMLALKCLQLMNNELKYNICSAPEELIVFCREATNEPYEINKISAALGYSCVYWASHLTETSVLGAEVLGALDIFLKQHLLHWLECISLLNRLETGIESLKSVSTLLQKLGQDHELMLLAYDALRFLQMSFEVIQQHAMETYYSALVWIPKGSLLRKVYAGEVGRAPKVTIGLSQSWGPMEITLQHRSRVNSVAFSPDGSQLACGSGSKVHIWNTATGKLAVELEGNTDSMVESVAFSPVGSQLASGSEKGIQIWNTATGKSEVELKGHTSRVRSVAFSCDGSRLASGSRNETVQIWNTATGELEVELKGHMDRLSSVAFSPDDSRLAYGSCDKAVWILNIAAERLESELSHTYLVRSVKFSPDGSRLASGSDDKIVRIWNTTTRELEVELKGHTSEVFSVTFSPDGSQLASGSCDGTVQIWNTITGESEVELKGHTDWVNSVAFSPDGSRLASGSWDGTVQIWNTGTGRFEVEQKGHTDLIQSVAFSSDGSQLASGSCDGTVWIWNTITGKAEIELKSLTSDVVSVAFSTDGSQLASGSCDGTVQIWNTTTHESVVELKGPTDSVQSIAFSPDGSHLASGTCDDTVQIWNMTTGKSEVELKGHTYFVWCVAFSSDGSQLASGSDDKTVRVWNIATGKLVVQLEGHTGSVHCVAFSLDGSQLASGSDDDTVRIWNIATGELEVELKGHTSTISSVAFSPDGSRLASGSSDKTVQIWNTATGQSEVELKGHTSEASSVAFSSDGSQLASGSGDGTVRIWNSVTGRLVELKDHTDLVRSVAFSPNGNRLASGSQDGTVQIWNTITGESMVKFPGQQIGVVSVAFFSDGSQLASGLRDGTVQIWNTATGKLEGKLKVATRSVTSIAFSADGSQVAYGSHDYRVWIWNTATGQLESDLKGHKGWVGSVAFSPVGSQLASGSDDNTVQIWNTATAKLEVELKGHTSEVLSVAFSPDGSQLASGSVDKTVRIWNTATGELEVLKGLTAWIGSVAFSSDGSQLASGSDFNLVRKWKHSSNRKEAHTSWVQSVAFSPDNNWVGSKCDCWVSPREGIISSCAYFSSTVALGFQSGKLVILELAPTS
ncbi:hypothetical protein D9758_008072 [Tetrapyrgos nigripes]|uniref:WD40 repeat-like protein n=1 Tax=Tetrapyrgos nigripes TaxID=182062 RepID=A0A8H5D0F2_9AGAR|nr:hypothetical protein D9758_008072 [Tetrapyrgos nigripes]